MASSDGDGRNLEPGSDFEAVVSDTRAETATPGGVGASGGRPLDRALAPFSQQRTPRQRLLRQAGIAATVLLALVIVAGGIPALRNRAIGLVFPPPAPTIAPGTDEFTLLPNPPGVTVSLDGHALAHLPAPGDPNPLHLLPGRHTFAWQSRIYPFVPQSCVVSVPPAHGDTCVLVDSDELRAQGVLVRGNVLAMHPTLFTLRATDLFDLQQAIRIVLGTNALSATVQPGEAYYTTMPSGAASSAVATQALQATLSLNVNAFSGGSNPCIPSQIDLPCQFQGQDCIELCTVLNPPPSTTAGTPDAWIAAAAAVPTWTYNPPGSQDVAAYPDAGVYAVMVILRITWDGAAWHVTPLFGHTPGLSVTDDAACDAARYWVASSSWRFMVTDPPPGAQVDFVSDASPADGCLVILNQAPGSATPALFLERFGLLRTLNATARNAQDGFPQASAADQQVAQMLAAKGG